MIVEICDEIIKFLKHHNGTPLSAEKMAKKSPTSIGRAFQSQIKPG